MRTLNRGVAITIIALLGLLFASTSALAATPAASWAVKSVALPTNFSTEDNPFCEGEGVCDAYVVTVTNVGTAPSTGPVVVRDKLPAGIDAVEYEKAREHEPGHSEANHFGCELAPSLVTC